MTFFIFLCYNTCMKKVLIVDIDNVLVDNCILIMLNKFLGTEYKEEDFNDFRLENMLGTPERISEFYNFALNGDMYQYVSVLDGVLDVLPKLNERYDLFLCTDILLPNHEWLADKEFVSKFKMLKEKFSFLNPNQFIFMKRKQLLHADFMIDDNPTNFGKHIKNKLLFSAYHNLSLTNKDLKKQGLTRVNSWSEIANLLL